METVADILIGMFIGWCLNWGYFRWCRLLRTRHEFYADPIIKAKYGDDPNPEGWSYYEKNRRDI